MKLTEILKVKTPKKIFLFIYVETKKKKYDFIKINLCKILK